MGDYVLFLDLFDLGIFAININKSHCPRTVAAIQKIIPIKSRGIKQSGKFTITSNLKTRIENETKTFKEGDVSVDPSSGNIIVYLQNIEIQKSQILFGNIDEFEDLNNIKLTKGLEIRSSSELN